MEFKPENRRRRPDLNRGWRFCRFRSVLFLDGWSCFLVVGSSRFYVVFGRYCSRIVLDLLTTGVARIADLNDNHRCVATSVFSLYSHLLDSAPAHRARMEFLLHLEAGFNGRSGFESVVVVGRFSLPYVEMCERTVVDDLRVSQHFKCMVQFVSD